MAREHIAAAAGEAHRDELTETEPASDPANLLPLTVRDPTNVVTELAYDSFGNRTATVADAIGLKQATSFGYDSVGNVVSVTDPRGNTTTGT